MNLFIIFSKDETVKNYNDLEDLELFNDITYNNLNILFHKSVRLFKTSIICDENRLLDKKFLNEIVYQLHKCDYYIIYIYKTVLDKMDIRKMKNKLSYIIDNVFIGVDKDFFKYRYSQKKSKNVKSIHSFKNWALSFCE